MTKKVSSGRFECLQFDLYDDEFIIGIFTFLTIFVKYIKMNHNFIFAVNK